MINFPFLLLQISSTEVEGGLFDFNATLPLMALQFFALTVVLNVIFYKPIGHVLDERDEYIRNSLTSASASLLKANELTKQYEYQLAESRKKAQNIIKDAQQEAQNIVSIKIKEAQLDAEQLVAEAYNQLNIQKENALKTLETQVDVLSDKIKLKLLDN
uniref:ATP synthase CFO B' chain subunit II n=2 Tax=Gracilariopsis TaxID=2781 RepID=A0A1C9CEW7_9FLOR|nr:ATP synthase CF0 B' subunit [Gracilariopsis lemaneiformis]YP_009294642.1 ATP synthase CFO B' chain subunit II [Gracilariopsis chorda]AJO68483.1 ATP synthase CF0 B' subunit [Gracilariopsis lemaneiformis]AML79784.1 ATP synthase CF0 B' subunit [Gracilariopsis lemaneiformis]AOM66902.1 ATP synthase CFO B' chain subunit II [Gracilariopsis chorda]UAD88837.1 ATP synthase CF0 subunit II [Gracilariopsis chorda]